jgi:hypothetical protein
VENERSDLAGLSDQFRLVIAVSIWRLAPDLAGATGLYPIQSADITLEAGCREHDSSSPVELSVIPIPQSNPAKQLKVTVHGNRRHSGAAVS